MTTVPSNTTGTANLGSSNRWTRLTIVAATTLLALAPAASAAPPTNPAEHPYPIEVTIDGQTYRDGEDTLPGYDDVLCTPIPGVEYDFAANEIQYYDGGEVVATAPWTEWDRISSYETWRKQQQGSPTPTPSPGGGGGSTETTAGAAPPSATPKPSSSTTG